MPKERRFPVAAVEAAIKAAGLTEKQGDLLLEALRAWRPKVGRRLEDDAADLAVVIGLMAGGMNPHAACVKVVERFPEAARNAAKKRLYKKARKLKKQGAVGARRLEDLRRRLEEHEREIKEYEKRRRSEEVPE